MHHAADHLQGHGLVAGGVDQAGRASIDAQGVVAHRARAVGAVSRRKQTREVGIVVRAQHAFIHHQGVGAGRRSIQAWAVILEGQCSADVGGRGVGVAILVGDRRRQGDQVRRRQGLRIIVRRARTTIHVVGHGTDLIQGDHARGVHADGEHQRATGSHALHHATDHLQGHGLVSGSVDQAGRTGIDAQGVVAHRARAVGAVGGGEQTREVRIGVRA